MVLSLPLLAPGCSTNDVSSPSTTSSQASRCEEDIVSPASRMGAAGRAALLYPCDGAACSGSESFASDVQHVVSIEVEGEPDAVVHIESSEPDVADIRDVASTYDPCAKKLKAWATLSAGRPGSALLRVRDASGELDQIRVEVAQPAAIQLRVTPADAFAFQRARAEMLALEGEAWLVLPELYDARQRLLVGLPELTWSVGDPQVAELRTTPRTDGEQLAREHSGLGAAFLDTKRAGETGLSVRSENGTEASLLLRVVAP
jgi:hypothetical protein